MALPDVWATSPKLPRAPVVESMRAAARETRKPSLRMVREFTRLAFGPGKLQPHEYFYYRLFEDRYDERLQQAFVGKRLELTLHRVTCNPEYWALAHDKLACYGLLQSLGYPVPKTRAVFRRGARFPNLAGLGDGTALAAALRGGLDGPLFGKPVRGIRSGGVLSIVGYDGSTDSLRLAHGQAVGVDELVEALQLYAEDGYLFQEPIRQSPEVASICGETIATARVLVLLHREGAEIHRALWKVPVGTNVADNFWREGNVLAALDVKTGRVTRATQGVGPSLRELDSHPTSGKPLVGFVLPGWSGVCGLVLSAAGAFPDLRMQAWDVAFSAEGPVLVEVNVGGDYNLPQLTSGQGMLDERFVEFLHDCAAKRGLEKSLRPLKALAR